MAKPMTKKEFYKGMAESFSTAVKGAYEDMLQKAILEEREACAQMVDHILKPGGGTYGNAIRSRSTS
jgi:hypothetical protein